MAGFVRTWRRALVPSGFWGLDRVPAAAPPPAPAKPPDLAVTTVPEAPVTQRQLERIQRSLNQPSTLNLDDRQIRFYLEIIGRMPTFAEYARGYDFLNGPVKGGNPMSHQEFLNLVNPKELYSSGGITATDQLQWAVTNWIGQTLIKRALDELKTARTEREVMQIRERIDRELEALTGSVRGK
jgi:hypothetical protein